MWRVSASPITIRSSLSVCCCVRIFLKVDNLTLFEIFYKSWSAAQNPAHRGQSVHPENYLPLLSHSALPSHNTFTPENWQWKILSSYHPLLLHNNNMDYSTARGVKGEFLNKVRRKWWRRRRGSSHTYTAKQQQKNTKFHMFLLPKSTQTRNT